jgi:hypothetical protein
MSVHYRMPVAGRRAIVVFSGQTDLPWLHLLKAGFRHCFVAVDCLGKWVIINPLSNRTEISTVSGVMGADLASFYCSLGLRVVKTKTVDPGSRPLPWRPFTCVEAVVRVLGVRAPGVFTPWGLCKYLKKNKYLDMWEK